MTTQTATPGNRLNPLRLFYFPDWRMRYKLIVSFWALTLLYALVVGFVGLPQIREALLATGTTSLISSANSTASAVDQYLTDKVEDISAASQLPEFAAFLELPLLPNTRASALQALKALSARTDYESVALVDISGKAVLSSSEADIGTDLSFRDYVIAALKGNTFASDPTVSVVTNRPAVFFSAPVKDASGKILGVVRSRLSMNGIWGLVEKDKNAAGLGTYGMLLDQNGIRIANSLSLGRRDAMEGSMLLYTAVAPVSASEEKRLVDEKRFGKAAASNIQVVAMPDVANALVTPGVKSFESASDVSPERHQAAVSALSTKPWRYVLMTPIPVFTQTADSVRNLFTVVLLVVGALSLIVAYFLARSITDPIAELTRAADRISLGELDTKISFERKDEIGELAEAVSRMQASLQAAIERLRARRASH